MQHGAMRAANFWNVDILKHCSASSCFCGVFCCCCLIFFCLFLFLSVCVCAFYGSFFYPTTHHRHSLSTVKLQQFQSCTDIHKYSCNLKTEVDFAKETTSLLSLM